MAAAATVIRRDAHELQLASGRAVGIFPVCEEEEENIYFFSPPLPGSLKLGILMKIHEEEALFCTYLFPAS